MTTIDQLKAAYDDGQPVHPGRVRSAARKLPRADADALLASIDADDTPAVVDQLVAGREA